MLARLVLACLVCQVVVTSTTLSPSCTLVQHQWSESIIDADGTSWIEAITALVARVSGYWDPLMNCFASMTVSSTSDSSGIDALLRVWSSDVDAGAMVTSRTSPRLRGVDDDWSYIGPFLYGKTEYDGDVLAPLLHPVTRHVCDPRTHIKMTSINCLASFRDVVRVVRRVVMPLLPEREHALLNTRLDEKKLFAVAADNAPSGVVSGFRSIKGGFLPSTGASLGPAQVSVRHDELGALVQSLSDVSALEFVGWAFTTVLVENVDEAAQIEVHAQGIHSLFYVLADGPVIPIAADQYGKNYVFGFSIDGLRKASGGGRRSATLRIFARLRGSGQSGFSIKLSLRRGPFHLRLAPPLALPDFVDGGFFGTPSHANYTLHPRGAWLALPLTLLAAPSTYAVKEARFAIRDAANIGATYCVNDECLTATPHAPTEGPPLSTDMQRTEYLDTMQSMLEEEFTSWSTRHGSSFVGDRGIPTGQIAPLRVYFAPSSVNVGRGTACPVGAINISVTATISDVLSQDESAHVHAWVTATLRCRDPTRETFLFTHVDFDGSIVGAAARAPLPAADTANRVAVPVVLTLHGTGVSAQSQADSYKVGMRSGGFRFGVRSAWLVAPGRFGAHNWEGIGRRSALAALFHVGAASHDWRSLETPTTQFPAADTSAVIYAGHSMGGHGALHLAALDPDRAIGVMLLAPWITKEHYGAANTVFRLDRSRLDGVSRGALEATVSGNDPDLVAGNMRHVPVLIRVGQNDQTVHPFFARRIRRVLVESGHTDVTLDEVPGKEHWWWDTESPNDGGCMNDKTVRRFLDRVIKSHFNSTGRPDTVEFHATSVEHTPCRLGVCIMEQVHRYQLSSFRVRRVDAIVELQNVSNIARIKVVAVPSPFGSFVVRIGNTTFSGHAACVAHCSVDRSNIVSVWHFLLMDGVWHQITPSTSTTITDTGSTGLSFVGPFRVYAEKALAIATPSAAEDGVVHSYAVFLANLHFVAYDSFVPITPRGSESTRRPSVFALQRRQGDGSLLQEQRDVHFRFGRNETANRIEAGILFASDMGLAHAVLGIGLPTVPPMMRCPFCNMLPHSATSDATREGRGWGSFK